MITFIISIVSIVFFVLYFLYLRKERLTTKKVVLLGIFSAMSFILYMLPLIKYPQGGGITLFSMLPIMVLGLILGKREAVLCGLIFGFLKLLNGGSIINPAQFFLDYLFPSMALGLSGMFGADKKYKIILGCLFAGLISISMNVLSGALYFGQYAPEGINPWIYSMAYNFSSAGVEAVLTTGVICFMPLKFLKKKIAKEGELIHG